MLFTESIKKNSDFSFVYKTGKKKADFLLVMYVIKNNKDINRIGISVSKKVGNSVVRHRLKRLVKESYRLQEKKYNVGYDIVVVIRANAKTATYYDIAASMAKLSKKNGILNDKSDIN